MSEHEIVEESSPEKLTPAENAPAKELSNELEASETSEKPLVEEISVEQHLEETSGEPQLVEGHQEPPVHEEPQTKEITEETLPEEANGEPFVEGLTKEAPEKPPDDKDSPEPEIPDLPEVPSGDQPTKKVEIDEHGIEATKERKEDESSQQEVNMSEENVERKLPDADGKSVKSETITDEVAQKSQEGIITADSVKEAADGAEAQTEVKPDDIKEEAMRREDSVVVLSELTSHVSLHQIELPEIRGLAELEYEDESYLGGSTSEDGLEDGFFSKAVSTLGTKPYTESEDEEKMKKLKESARARVMVAKPKSLLEASEPEKVVKIEINRPEYYLLHEKYSKDYWLIRFRNRFLQRKLVEYFKKRKMEHALAGDSDLPIETTRKYEKKLERLADLLNEFNSETETINAELKILQTERDGVFQELDSLFTKLQEREMEIGTGLINTKTGKEITDKFVNQLIRQQTLALKQVSGLRLTFIRQRNEQTEKNEELKSLDNIGEDLSLMDYEQLKIENRSLSDKLEEREAELTVLRKKCRNEVQVMAHVREKTAALDADKAALSDLFEAVTLDYIEVRERLNQFKTARDLVRNRTMKLKSESGLLTKPKLLVDLETSMEEAKLLEHNLQKIRNDYNTTTQKIRILRKNITNEITANKRPPKGKRDTNKRNYFSSRPTLVSPKLPKDLFRDLKDMPIH